MRKTRYMILLALTILWLASIMMLQSRALMTFLGAPFADGGPFDNEHEIETGSSDEPVDQSEEPGESSSEETSSEGVSEEPSESAVDSAAEEENEVSHSEAGEDSLENSEPEAEAEEISPRYTLVNGWAYVEDETQFRTAVANGETHIRLSGDVTLPQQTDLNYSLVVDGTKEDGSGYWTFTDRRDRNSIWLTAQNLTVTFQNVNIIGKDFYGTVSQQAASGSNATVIYDNVTYTGPQIAYLRYDGTLVLRNSTVTLTDTGNSNVVEELGEVTQVIFSGNVTLNRPETNGNSLVWIYNYGSAKKGLIRFDDNCNVRINASGYLTYRELSPNGVSSLDIEVGNNAKVDLHMWGGWCLDSSRYVNNLTVGNQSVLTLSRSRTDLVDSYLFSISDSLKVGENSVFIFEDNRPAISFTSTSAVIEFNQPKEIRINQYMRGSIPASITMRGKVFNTWVANEVSNVPDNIFNGPYGELVTVHFNGNNGTISYTDDITGEMISSQVTSAFNPHGNGSMKEFAMGEYVLKTDTLYASSTTIAGTLSSDAVLSANYFPRDADTGNEANRRTTAAVTASGGGNGLHNFIVDPEIPANGEGIGSFAVNEEIYLSLIRYTNSHLNTKLTRQTRLYAMETRKVPEPGRLYIKSFPEILNFGSHEIPNRETYYPLEEDVGIVISDNRNDAELKEWKLIVSASPLHNGDLYTSLDEDAIGIMRDGVFFSMKGGAVLWTGTKDSENIDQSRTWSAHDLENGLVVNVSPYQSMSTDYQAVITWTLSVGV